MLRIISVAFSLTINNPTPVLELRTPSHPPSIAGRCPSAPTIPWMRRTSPPFTTIVCVMEQLEEMLYSPFDPILHRAYLGCPAPKRREALFCVWISHSGYARTNASSKAFRSFETWLYMAHAAERRMWHTEHSGKAVKKWSTRPWRAYTACFS